jgi:hypothetical protein
MLGCQSPGSSFSAGVPARKTRTRNGTTPTFQCIYRDSLNNQNPYVSSAVSITFQ